LVQLRTLFVCQIEAESFFHDTSFADTTS
jgi:hypothetical protein